MASKSTFPGAMLPGRGSELVNPLLQRLSESGASSMEDIRALPEWRAIADSSALMMSLVAREIARCLVATPKDHPLRPAMEKLLPLIVSHQAGPGTVLVAAAYYASQAPSRTDDDPFGSTQERPAPDVPSIPHTNPLKVTVDRIVALAAEAELSSELRDAAGVLARMIKARAVAGGFRPDSDWNSCQGWIEALEAVQVGTIRQYLEPGEAWSDAAIADVEAMEPGPKRTAWLNLIACAEDVPSGKLSQKWLATARSHLETIGPDDFKRAVVRWFPLVDRPRTSPQPRQNSWEPDWNLTIIPGHVAVLRVLVALCAGLDDRDVARALVKLAASSYRKIPGVGARLIVLGNACVSVLGSLPGVEAVALLAMLKTRVKFGSARREIEKAFDAAAKREGLPRAEIEELAVPAYGMEEVGRRVEEFGDYGAEMVAGADGVTIRWGKADGSTLKSVPAAVKRDHAADWKELQAAAKDAEAMLTSARDRLDSMFLARKSWSLAAWRDRYLDHPLVGVLARRLIWAITEGSTTRDVIHAGGTLADREGRPVEPGDDATVSLWHPIGHPMEEVLGWRDRLEQLQIRQPFKQAHREVYLLTDAERRTSTYSNRFAAHILKQHQFHALCAARGWKNQLRLMVDDSYAPASRLLPEWGLRAEYWIEGAGDNYGQDTTDSGAYLYLATDQVRFYRIDAAQATAHAGGGAYSVWRGEDKPLRLEEVTPLALSEIMRDVDLFVGVASVGNDPNWADGGRHVDYWQGYSFGDLSATAVTRKSVLEKIVPRLKIADRCRFSEKFLVVRGDLRTYKIHLGSGNILMEPNDQYLCIVPKSSGAGQGGVFLPFEGDRILSIILSKALMLVEDKKIKDQTITRQIAGM